MHLEMATATSLIALVLSINDLKLCAQILVQEVKKRLRDIKNCN